MSLNFLLGKANVNGFLQMFIIFMQIQLNSFSFHSLDVLDFLKLNHRLLSVSNSINILGF